MLVATRRIARTEHERGRNDAPNCLAFPVRGPSISKRAVQRFNTTHVVGAIVANEGARPFALA